jgi:hypothetical protein
MHEFITIRASRGSGAGAWERVPPQADGCSVTSCPQLYAVLWETVEEAFLSTPVVLVLPVVHEFLTYARFAP